MRCPGTPRQGLIWTQTHDQGPVSQPELIILLYFPFGPRMGAGCSRGYRLEWGEKVGLHGSIPQGNAKMYSDWMHLGHVSTVDQSLCSGMGVWLAVYWITASPLEAHWVKGRRRGGPLREVSCAELGAGPGPRGVE